MAYQGAIVRASQNYTGLAWVHYDSTFQRQAVLAGLTVVSNQPDPIYPLLRGVSKDFHNV